VHRRYSIRYIGGFGGGDFGNSMDFFLVILAASSSRMPPSRPRAGFNEQADHCWGSPLHRDGLEQVGPERLEEHKDGQ
jgi:hypothetical protein